MRKLLIVLIATACAAATIEARQAATTPPPPPPPPPAAPAAPAPAVVQAPTPVPAPAVAAAPASRGRAAQGTTRPVQARVPPAPPPPPGAPTTVPIAPVPPAMAKKIPTQNVRVDITITDSFGAGPTKKTVTLLVADTRPGSIRSSMSIPESVSPGAPVASWVNISLNVDATPDVLPDGRVFLTITVLYIPDSAVQQPGGSRKPGSLNESLAVVLGDGKQTLISQSADPQGDRKVMLEVTATVVK